MSFVTAAIHQLGVLDTATINPAVYSCRQTGLWFVSLGCHAGSRLHIAETADQPCPFVQLRINRELHAPRPTCMCLLGSVSADTLAPDVAVFYIYHTNI